MPKVLPVDVLKRTMVRDAQLPEQLVEVPTIVSFLELNVDNPVPRGGDGGGLHGFLPGRNSVREKEMPEAEASPRNSIDRRVNTS